MYHVCLLDLSAAFDTIHHNISAMLNYAGEAGEAGKAGDGNTGAFTAGAAAKMARAVR